MTLEINPVLAGTYEAPDYVPARNFASRDVEAVTDSRRYTQFDRRAAESGTATDFDFGDLLDLVNPLQHIPVVSSVYRSLTGEQIHPVSRVAGDILYGGLMGPASMIMGAAGGVADAMMEAKTGEDAAGYAVSLLFGPDEDKSVTQLAQADKPEPTVEPALTAMAEAPPPVAPGDEKKLLAALAQPPAMPPVPAAVPAPASSATELPADNSNIAPEIRALAAAKAYPLNPRKLPYGGVMDTTLTQQQAMAMALATGAPTMRMGDTIYTGRLMTGARSSSPAAAQPQAPSSGNPLPPDLVQDLMMMKAIKNYKSTADKTAPAGSTVDVVN
ncbi:MAG: hypothetical protein SFW62_02225 [Alphaproteobacteria bacterium]|nr:hypothetical protein [Alphaproteobacteria bacterium]